MSIHTFQNYIKNAKTETATGGGWHIDFWGVPKTNFPDGLPPHIEQAQVKPDMLEHWELAGGNSAKADTDSYFIIDQRISRVELGANVLTFAFLAAAQRHCKKTQRPA